MWQTYLTMMTILVIGFGSMVFSLPVEKSAAESTTLKAPLGDFESHVNQVFAVFSNQVAAEIISIAPTSTSLRYEDVVTYVIDYLTKLANDFLLAIETIVTDILISMWYNPRPAEEVLHEMTVAFTQEFFKLFQGLYELIVELENHFELTPRKLTQQLQNAIQSLLSSLAHEVREVYIIVAEIIAERSSIIDWMLNFFNLQPIAFVIYSLPMSILHTLMQVATQLLFASAAVLAQAQIIFDQMMHQILEDINNAALYVWNAITALTLLPGIGK